MPTENEIAHIIEEIHAQYLANFDATVERLRHEGVEGALAANAAVVNHMRKTAFPIPVQFCPFSGDGRGHYIAVATHDGHEEVLNIPFDKIYEQTDDPPKDTLLPLTKVIYVISTYDKPCPFCQYECNPEE